MGRPGNVVHLSLSEKWGHLHLHLLNQKMGAPKL